MSDVGSTVKEILARMPSSLDAAQGMHANIQLVLTGEGAWDYYLQVDDGACQRFGPHGRR